jgi:hypothetical protein
MKYVMFYDVTPEGMALARANFPAHRARLDEFHARGTLLLAGPLGSPPEGALGVFITREAAEEFIAGDPFVLNGVVSKWRILEWREVLG